MESSNLSMGVVIAFAVLLKHPQNNHAIVFSLVGEELAQAWLT
jgi:hypothetical protein